MRRLQQWLLAFIALCVMAQSVALSAERTVGRAHFHRSPLAAIDHVNPSHAGLDGHRYVPQMQQDVGHSTVEHHQHDGSVPGVVDVAQDHGASSLNPHATLTRSIHDLDVLVPSLELAADSGTFLGWATAPPRPFGSHVDGPLERPPRG